MRISIFKTKTISIFLILLFLLQSCHIYKRHPVTFEEAVATNNKVILTKTDDSRQKCKKIVQVDSVYYSMTKSKGEQVKTPINQREIKSVRVLNTSASTWGNVGIINGGVFLGSSIYVLNAMITAMESGG